MYNKNLIRQPSGQINLMSRQEVYWWWFSRQVVSDSCDPKDRSLPDSSFHGILQARILEWVAISCSKRYTRVTVFKKYAKFQGKSILKAIDKPQNINNKRSFEIFWDLFMPCWIFQEKASESWSDCWHQGEAPQGSALSSCPGIIHFGIAMSPLSSIQWDSQSTAPSP